MPAASATLSVTTPLVVPLSKTAPVVPAAVPIVTVEARVGAVPKTSKPVPVSSEITAASWAEVVAAKYVVDSVGLVHAVWFVPSVVRK